MHTIYYKYSTIYYVYQRILHCTSRKIRIGYTLYMPSISQVFCLYMHDIYHAYTMYIKEFCTVHPENSNRIYIVYAKYTPKYCTQSKRRRLGLTIRARDWLRIGTIIECAGARLRAEGFQVPGRSYLFHWASNARTVGVTLGLGLA